MLFDSLTAAHHTWQVSEDAVAQLVRMMQKLPLWSSTCSMNGLRHAMPGSRAPPAQGYGLLNFGSGPMSQNPMRAMYAPRALGKPPCRPLHLMSRLLHQDFLYTQAPLQGNGYGGYPVGMRGGPRRGGAPPGRDKVNYDTFFTMKRLLERSRTPEELLRWLVQNPTKVSPSHYPVALQRLAQLLQQQHQGMAKEVGNKKAEDDRSSLTTNGQELQMLYQGIIKHCPQFDNYGVVNCLYALAAMGISGELPVVRVLEDEARARLPHFNHKDISMLFSSIMRLHPSAPQSHPLVAPCLNCLERNMERERHPQTLFLLLSYYRLLTTAVGHSFGTVTSAGKGSGNDGLVSEGIGNTMQANVERKVLRLVRHTLALVGSVRDHELSLLDEMLAACASQVSNRALEAIFSSQLFYENRHEKFIMKLAEELPRKVGSLTPYTLGLIAKYLARHRLREPRLLDAIATFLVRRADQLDSKLLQKLVFPFSRMNYRPTNDERLLERLESAITQKALQSPLATVNIIMSMVQLGHFPSCSLTKVFSPPFIRNVMSSPYGLIVRRYLSLLDTAIELEFGEYVGPRLAEQYKVTMFDHALTADEVNRKYSYKGLVAEALRQLVGVESYKQDEVLPPGYYTDFLLFLDADGSLLPIHSSNRNDVDQAMCSSQAQSRATKPISTDTTVTALASDLQRLSPFRNEAAEMTIAQDTLHSPVIPPNTIASTAVTTSTICVSASFLSPALGPVPFATIAPRPRLPMVEHCVTLRVAQSAGPPESDSGSQEEMMTTPLLPAECPGVLSPTGFYHYYPNGLGGPPEVLPNMATMFGTDEQVVQRYYKPPFSHEKADGLPLAQAVCEKPVPERNNEARMLEKVQRVVMSVNDKWHYCHNSDVLVGSRAMRDRHLKLMGYEIIQLPYHELEKLNGIEEVKKYLQNKLQELRTL
uniref:Fas-activated serine/threonine kinase n=1 Tax=Eptatretus burgeri TaxID=7764 RepID=A0A8C4NMH8_EPTBU